MSSVKTKTSKQRLIENFPSVCDLEWLSSLQSGDRVIYCWRGSADYLYPRLASFSRRGKTFIDVQIDREYPDSTRIAADGMSRWYDVAYYAFIAPAEKLQEEFERSNKQRQKFNLTANGCKMQTFDFPSFGWLHNE